MNGNHWVFQPFKGHTDNNNLLLIKITMLAWHILRTLQAFSHLIHKQSSG